MTITCPSQAMFGGYTRLKRVDDILTYDRMERWLNILLLWASSFEAGLKTKPTPEQVQTVRADFPKYALLKAREFPLRICYYDFECFNSFGLLIDQQGSLGAYKNQVSHTPQPCRHAPLPSRSPAVTLPYRHAAGCRRLDESLQRRVAEFQQWIRQMCRRATEMCVAQHLLRPDCCCARTCSNALSLSWSLLWSFTRSTCGARCRSNQGFLREPSRASRFG